jgi:hypothetical protein
VNTDQLRELYNQSQLLRLSLFPYVVLKEDAPVPNRKRGRVIAKNLSSDYLLIEDRRGYYAFNPYSKKLPLHGPFTLQNWLCAVQRNAFEGEAYCRDDAYTLLGESSDSEVDEAAEILRLLKSIPQSKDGVTLDLERLIRSVVTKRDAFEKVRELRYTSVAFVEEVCCRFVTQELRVEFVASLVTARVISHARGETLVDPISLEIRLNRIKG